MGNYTLSRFVTPNPTVAVSELGTDISTTAALGLAAQNFDTYAARINDTNTFTAAQTFSANIITSGGAYIAAGGANPSASPGDISASRSGTAGYFLFGTDGNAYMGRVGSASWTFVTNSGAIGIDCNGTGRGLTIGAASTNNDIWTSSQGASTTTMYIGNASITVSSDSRLKKNITDTAVNATVLLNNLRVVDYDWDDPSEADNPEHNKASRGRWTGMVAQEMVKVVPWLVNAEDRDCPTCLAGKPCEDHTSDWHVDLAHMAGLFVKGFQEMDARLTAAGL